MQEEVSDAGSFQPGQVGGGAGEDAGLVLRRAANWAKADDAVNFPATMTMPAEQGAT